MAPTPPSIWRRCSPRPRRPRPPTRTDGGGALRGLRIVLASLSLAGTLQAEPLRPLSRPPHVSVAPEAIGLRPLARDPYLPAARWDGRPEGALWTRTMMVAMASHGKAATQVIPVDIGEWCPAYVTADESRRRAFWVGLMSGVAWYESTHRPAAVGGGGLYHGLLQILPRTADWLNCRARSGEALRRGPANLSCAARILGTVVPRDGAVAQFRNRWRGVANQWGPLTRAGVRDRLAAWTRAQDYCRPEPPRRALRPPARPGSVAVIPVSSPR